MKKLLLFLFCIPFLSFAQEVNHTDVDGNKQGVWTKSYKNGKVRYKGQFKNDKPFGLFYYYQISGELQAEKKFFHNGTAAATHIFYKGGELQAAGLYVNELKPCLTEDFKYETQDLGN